MKLITSILRSINRNPDRPLNILTANNHENYSATLAKTGHNFYMLQHNRFHRWDVKESQLPDNIHFLTGKDINQQIKYDLSFDLVLQQNQIEHYPILSQIASQLSCPLLSLHHTQPWVDWDDDTIKHVGSLACNHNIFVSRFAAESWGFDPDNKDVSIIWHGMDTDYWNGWVGGDGKIMTAVWNFIERDRICGFSLFEEVTNGLPINPWGDTPGFSVSAKNRDHLRELYRRASVYLNTTLWSSCPFSLLEAMSVGCPVVTTATTMMPEFIEDGVNGFISNDTAILRKRVEDLINDPSLGRRIGEAGRQTIIEKFGQQRFINEWNKVLYATSNMPPNAII